MSWAMVAISAGTAIKGGIDAKAASKRADRNDAFRKASIRYSPWTGMGDPGAPNVGNTDVLSGAIGGGLQGYSMASGMGLGGGSAAPSGGSMGSSGMSQGAGISTMNYQTPSQPVNPWGDQSLSYSQRVS